MYENSFLWIILIPRYRIREGHINIDDYPKLIIFNNDFLFTFIQKVMLFLCKNLLKNVKKKVQICLIAYQKLTDRI